MNPYPIPEPNCLSEQEEDRQSSLRELKEDEWVEEESTARFEREQSLEVGE